MGKGILIGLISLMGFCLQAQTNLNSLWNIWEDQSQHDTSRLDALYQFIRNRKLFSKPDSALYFAQIEYDHAEGKGL